MLRTHAWLLKNSLLLITTEPWNSQKHSPAKYGIVHLICNIAEPHAWVRATMESHAWIRGQHYGFSPIDTSR